MPASSVSSVEDIRFRPISPTHSAVSRVAEPHQMRSRRPLECGVIGSSVPRGARAGSASTMPSPSMARRNVANFSRAMSAPRGSLLPV